MSIEVRPTDKFFYNSPDSGDKECICSRCGKPIPAKQAPILRVWPTDPRDHGFDTKAKGGTEFRYCWPCCNAMGVLFGEPDEDSIDDINDIL